MKSLHLKHVFVLLAFGGLATGCSILASGSISASSGSISVSLRTMSTSLESMSDSFDSASRSSAGDEDEGAAAAYRRDVRNFTAAFVGSDATHDEFLRSLGRIAEQHGITHWERERATYVAVGAGLRQGGIDRGEMLALQESLAGANAGALRSLLEGYES